MKYQLGLYEKSIPNHYSIEEKLRYCKEFGFDYLEISIDETVEKLARLDWTPAEKDAVIQAIRAENVKINSMCLSGHRKYPLGSLDDETVKCSLEIMQKAIDLASDLGIRIIQLAGYDVYYEEATSLTRARFIDNLKKAAEMAALKGVMLGFETMETAFMDTVQKSMEYVNLVNNPYLNVYPDIGNLTNASLIYNTSVTEDIKTGTGHIVAAHLKETIPNHYREIPFGTGHTQYIEDILCLKALGVRLFVGEFWYVGQANWQDDCKAAAVFLRKHLDQAFAA